MGNITQVVIKDEEQKIKYINNVDTYKNILKIERPKYEVVEEKKELLTEEEKEFLRQIIKFANEKIYAISIKMIIDQKSICFRNVSGSGDWYYIKNNFFNNLEIDKVYTLKELGLEEK